MLKPNLGVHSYFYYKSLVHKPNPGVHCYFSVHLLLRIMTERESVVNGYMTYFLNHYIPVQDMVKTGIRCHFLPLQKD